MANSKRKTILNYLRDTVLPAIQTGNGYNTTVVKIERGLKSIYDELNESDYPSLFISKTVEERENITVNQFQAILTVSIVGYVKNPNGVSGIQVALDNLIEDVTKALETDRLQGGNVKGTEIKKIETDYGDLEPHGAFVLDVEFMYVSEGVAP